MMSSNRIEMFRSKIAAYTWRYPDIPINIIDREYQMLGHHRINHAEQLNQAIINIVTCAIEYKIIDFDDLTRAGYRAIMHAYSRKNPPGSSWSH